MIALIIIFCIIFALFLLLLMRVRLRLILKDGQLKAYIGILFFRYELYSDKRSKIKKSDFKIKKFRRRRDKVLKKYRIEKTPKNKLKRETSKTHTSPILLINKLRLMFSEAISLFGKYHRIDKFNFDITVGGDDAAKTAINYGYTITSLQFLITFLERYSNLDKTENKNANVVADFKNGEWNMKLDIIGSVRVLNILRIGMSALIGYLKHKDINTAKAGNNKK